MVGQKMLSSLCFHCKDRLQLSPPRASSRTNCPSSDGPCPTRHLAGCGELGLLCLSQTGSLLPCYPGPNGCNTGASFVLWNCGIRQWSSTREKAVRNQNLCGVGTFQGNWKGGKICLVVVVVRLKASKKFQSRVSKMKFFSS